MMMDIVAMPVKKNVVNPLNSLSSAYQLVNQNWHKMQSQSTYISGMPPDSHVLHVDCV